MSKIAVIIPTYNAGLQWSDCIDAIQSQSLLPDSILLIDSSSQDNTVSKGCAAGFDVEKIESSAFDHGGTRKLAANKYQDYDFLIYMTQDALLVDADSFKNILLPFKDEAISAVCGRQLPRTSAGKIESHARLFNYSGLSVVRRVSDRKQFGLKTAFLSNSFAAYRVSVLNEIGSFPDKVVFGEDMYVAAKMLNKGHKIAYAADAAVYHSHGYTIWQEMKRYFDMGVFHAREPWIREGLGGAEGEGVKFVVSEVKYLLKQAFWLIPEGLFRTLTRYAGFRLGLLEKWLPLVVKRRFAMNKAYFKQ